MGKQNKSRKGLRIFLGVICVLLAIVLGVMVAGTVLADTILGNMNYVEKGQSATMSMEEAEALKQQMASEDAAAQTETQDGTEEPTEKFTGPVLSEGDVDLSVEIGEGIGEGKEI